MRRVSNRKAQILDLATHLFSQNGYDRVTIKQLADGCGITEPAIYRHFDSKEAIFNTVLETLKSKVDVTEPFERLSKEDDIESLLLGIAGLIIEFYSHNVDLYRLLLYSALKGYERGKRNFELLRGTYVSFLKNQLDRLYAAGSIVERNNEITARCFVGMVFDCAMGAAVWKSIEGETYSPNEIAVVNIATIARGLRK